MDISSRVQLRPNPLAVLDSRPMSMSGMPVQTSYRDDGRLIPTIMGLPASYNYGRNSEPKTNTPITLNVTSFRSLRNNEPAVTSLAQNELVFSRRHNTASPHQSNSKLIGSLKYAHDTDIGYRHPVELFSLQGLNYLLRNDPYLRSIKDPMHILDEFSFMGVVLSVDQLNTQHRGWDVAPRINAAVNIKGSMPVPNIWHLNHTQTYPVGLRLVHISLKAPPTIKSASIAAAASRPAPRWERSIASTGSLESSGLGPKTTDMRPADIPPLVSSMAAAASSVSRPAPRSYPSVASTGSLESSGSGPKTTDKRAAGVPSITPPPLVSSAAAFPKNNDNMPPEFLSLEQLRARWIEDFDQKQKKKLSIEKLDQAWASMNSDQVFEKLVDASTESFIKFCGWKNIEFKNEIWGYQGAIYATLLAKEFELFFDVGDHAKDTVWLQTFKEHKKVPAKDRWSTKTKEEMKSRSKFLKPFDEKVFGSQCEKMVKQYTEKMKESLDPMEHAFKVTGSELSYAYLLIFEGVTMKVPQYTYKRNFEYFIAGQIFESVTDATGVRDLQLQSYELLVSAVTTLRTYQKPRGDLSTWGNLLSALIKGNPLTGPGIENAFRELSGELPKPTESLTKTKTPETSSVDPSVDTKSFLDRLMNPESPGFLDEWKKEWVDCVTADEKNFQPTKTLEESLNKMSIDQKFELINAPDNAISAKAGWTGEVHKDIIPIVKEAVYVIIMESAFKLYFLFDGDDELQNLWREVYNIHKTVPEAERWSPKTRSMLMETFDWLREYSFDYLKTQVVSFNKRQELHYKTPGAVLFALQPLVRAAESDLASTCALVHTRIRIKDPKTSFTQAFNDNVRLSLFTYAKNITGIEDFTDESYELVFCATHVFKQLTGFTPKLWQERLASLTGAKKPTSANIITAFESAKQKTNINSASLVDVKSEGFHERRAFENREMYSLLRSGAAASSKESDEVFNIAENRTGFWQFTPVVLFPNMHDQEASSARTDPMSSQTHTEDGLTVRIGSISVQKPARLDKQTVMQIQDQQLAYAHPKDTDWHTRSKDIPRAILHINS